MANTTGSRDSVTTSFRVRWWLFHRFGIGSPSKLYEEYGRRVLMPAIFAAFNVPPACVGVLTNEAVHPDSGTR